MNLVGLNAYPLEPGACQTWAMSEDRLYLIDTFALILSVSASRIRETLPLEIEVVHG